MIAPLILKAISNTVGGGGPQPEENPTRTIPGNQEIEQQVERICKHKVIVKRKQATDKQLLNIKVIN